MPECRDCERVGKDKKKIGRKKVIVCLVEGKHSSHIIIIIAFQSSRKEILDLYFDLFYYLFKFFSSSFSLLSLPRSPLFRFPIHSWVHVCCYYQMFMHAKYYIMHKWNIEDCELFTVFFLPFFLASPFFPLDVLLGCLSCWCSLAASWTEWKNKPQSSACCECK